MKTSKTQRSRANRRPVSAARKPSRPSDPLVSTPAEAKRESAGLRRGRENLESDATVDEMDIRTSIP